MIDAFARRLLDWFDQHGRKDLPWQRSRSPYRVWVSEIMLQQTQVATVIPYFERFMARFPTLSDLAAADADEVMAMWSGLGYYSRARNLHRAARICVAKHDGHLPEDFESLVALPGIGRSTAGAILAQSLGQRHPILDGNVKRVLARVHGIEGWPGRTAVAGRLWQLADTHTPDERVADYTQAIMDLGATVCLPRNPSCDRCPVAAECTARAEGMVDRLPTPRPRKTLPERHAFVLVIDDGRGRVLLERRPPTGIWGGLHAPPMAEDLDGVGTCHPTAAPIRHGFTHFRLILTPVLVRAGSAHASMADIMDGDTRWVAQPELEDLGLPSPIQTLLNQHFRDELQWQERFIV